MQAGACKGPRAEVFGAVWTPAPRAALWQLSLSSVLGRSGQWAADRGKQGSPVLQSLCRPPGPRPVALGRGQRYSSYSGV